MLVSQVVSQDSGGGSGGVPCWRLCCCQIISEGIYWGEVCWLNIQNQHIGDSSAGSPVGGGSISCLVHT